MMNRLAFAGWVVGCLLFALAGCGQPATAPLPNAGTALDDPRSLAEPRSLADQTAHLPTEKPLASFLLRDVTHQTEVTFHHTDGGSGAHYIVETVASGLATFDYDGDGLVDLYFLNGRPLGGQPATAPTNALYRNLGGFRFVDVTSAAGVGDEGYALGVCVGDFNNDGMPDLFVNNFGANVLYFNNGDGTFTNVTTDSVAGPSDAVGAGANFFDFDGDGNLDLFITHYVGFTYENHVTNIVRGAPWYAGPLDFPPQANRLLRNEGNGVFTDVSEDAGIAAHAGAGMGSICLDYDGDGHTDIFVCNDQRWDFLFRNDGRGKFTEVALQAGAACNYAGETMGSMGVDCADYDRDGRLDLYVTSFEQQLPVLYRNLGGGLFEDATIRSGAGTGAFAQVKWGVGLVDLDNDGFVDAFIGCGHLGEDFDENASRTSSYAARPVLLKNGGDGKFRDVSHLSGDAMQIEMVARGVAFDDLDNDGRVDVTILNSRRGPTILRNESSPANHWIQIRLHGVISNRDGVGARVKVAAEDWEQIAEVHSGRGYQSHFGTLLTFGLGQCRRIDRIEVCWPGGGTDVLKELDVDQRISIVQGVYCQNDFAN